MATNVIDTIIKTSLDVSRNHVAKYVYFVLVRDQLISMSLDKNTQGRIAIQFWESGSSIIPEGKLIENNIISKLALTSGSLSSYDIKLFIQRVGYELAVDIPVE